MKLYQTDLSPFASRVRMQIYAKGLEGTTIDVLPPPGGTGSPEYRHMNPTGKIPALDTGTRVLPESEVICEFIEDTFPQPALRPDGPLERAQVRLMARLVDLYLYPRMAPLYGQVDPGHRNAEILARGLSDADEGLTIFERLLLDGGYRDGPFAVGHALTLADCALVPILFFADAVLPMLGRSRAFAAVPAVEGYWRAASETPVARRVLAEMRIALAEMMKARTG